MSLMFASLNRQILLVKAHMLAEQVPLERRRQILSRTLTGLIPYAIATALACVSAYVTLAICAAIAVFYAFPFASGVQPPS